ncbi:pantoate--beta-alanine ligase [Opitutia bacterium KCR 482]|nr:pantoate--beta-alanine ligase [Opitutae bacterium KCR 482]MDY5583534.1 pantoate--beta-alanine ligase [Candidatus Merdousia sp.]
MKIISSPKEMKEFSANAKAAGKKIALVPTMGALHDGHLSLIDKAKSLADVVVVSVFVNPTQFGPNEDYDKYPRQLEADVAKCEEHAADVVFAPSPSDIYAPDASTFVSEEQISQNLCGKSRPKHFRGVTTVVSILFNIVKPDFGVFGEKDAQQVSIIERMVRDLFMDVEIVRAPIVREQSGLALSSRNKYMTQAERDGATRIRKSLLAGKALVDEGCTNIDRVKALVINTLADPKTRIIYVEIVDAKTSLPVSELAKGKCRISLAVWYGQTRLIDNIVV